MLKNGHHELLKLAKNSQNPVTLVSTYGLGKHHGLLLIESNYLPTYRLA